MDHKNSQFECQGTVRMGFSRFGYVLDCLFGILGRIQVFDDRIVLCQGWKSREFFLPNIKAIQVATFFGHKVGIIIFLESGEKSPYIKFVTIVESNVEALMKVLIAEGYPVEVGIHK